MSKKKSLRDVGRKHAEKRGGRIELEPLMARMREDYGHGPTSLAVFDAGRSVAEQSAYRAAPYPGDVLEGFCRGAFGRDSYGAKTVIASGVQHGAIWIVVREEGRLILAQDVTPEDIETWRADAAEDEEQER